MTATQRQKMPWATQTYLCKKQHHNLWLRISVRSVKRKVSCVFSVNSQYSTDPFPKEKECPVSSESALLWEVNSWKNLICTCCLPIHFLVVVSGAKMCQNPMLYNISPAQKNLNHRLNSILNHVVIKKVLKTTKSEECGIHTIPVVGSELCSVGGLESYGKSYILG